MNLLALDPSSKRIGAAIFIDDVLKDAFVLKPDRDADPWITRVTSMSVDLRALIAEYAITACVVEQPLSVAFRGRGGSNAVVQRAYGRVIQIIIDADVELHEWAVREWTKGKSKVSRADSVKGLDRAKDSGLDGHDAVELGKAWIEKGRIKKAIGGRQ